MALAIYRQPPSADPNLDLYRRAREDGQWIVASAVSWQAPVTLSPDRQEFAWNLASRHVYAEQTGLVIAAKLLEEAEDASLRLSLATAVSDEAKHSEVFAQYAAKLGGSINPPTDAADSFDAQLRGLPGPEVRFVVHTVLEGLALDEFVLLARLFKGDLLHDIYKLVRRDEARHVALGLNYIGRQLGQSEFWRHNFDSYQQEGLNAAGLHSESLNSLGSQLGMPPGGVARWLTARHRARMSHLLARAGLPT